MKETIKIDYQLNYEQYKNEDIYYYKIFSKNSIIKNEKGFTNKEGIEKLLKGGTNIKNFDYLYLNENELENFRNMDFLEALKLIKNNKNIDFNNEENNLYKLEGSSHNIFDLNNNLLPKFLNLNNPLYLINNNNFDLDKVLEIISKDKRFVSINNKSIYEKAIKEVDDFKITNIPYYNADDDRDAYLNIGFTPTNEDWNKLIQIAKENNLISKDGYISDLSILALKLNIIPLEFKDKNNYDYVIKNIKFNKPENLDIDFNR